MSSLSQETPRSSKCKLSPFLSSYLPKKLQASRYATPFFFGDKCATKGNLAAHVKCVHDKVKPHSCDVCHKAFTIKGDLDQHKLVHSGVKPHECQLCDVKFARSDALARLGVGRKVGAQSGFLCQAKYNRLEVTPRKQSVPRARTDSGENRFRALTPKRWHFLDRKFAA